MTLVELQEVLGKQIEAITDTREPFENRKRLSETALVVSSLAKQMINNADVVLRSEKIFRDGKLGDSEIMKMVSGGYVLMKKGENGELIGHTLE